GRDALSSLPGARARGNEVLRQLRRSRSGGQRVPEVPGARAAGHEVLWQLRAEHGRGLAWRLSEVQRGRGSRREVLRHLRAVAGLGAVSADTPKWLRGAGRGASAPSSEPATS